MNNEDYTVIGFENLKNVDYIDDDTAFIKDIRALPFTDGPLKVDMFAIVTCVDGIMKVELNHAECTLHPNEVMIIQPYTLMGDYNISLDFSGYALCLSRNRLLKHISENELWEKALCIAENPIIQVNEESLQQIISYVNTVILRITKKDHPYNKEIVASIVKVILYEILSNISCISEEIHGSNLIKQRDVLFRRFLELLIGSKVKPRYVSWYADRLCVVPKHLSSVCKDVSGKTAFEWITQYVLADIQNLLKYSNKSIKEISDAMNFPNISFFGKYCRRHFGVSPTIYREQLRKSPCHKSPL